MIRNSLLLPLLLVVLSSEQSGVSAEDASAWTVARNFLLSIRPDPSQNCSSLYDCTYQCWSDPSITYQISGFTRDLELSALCPGDPGFYQVCATRGFTGTGSADDDGISYRYNDNVTTHPLCDYYICGYKKAPFLPTIYKADTWSMREVHCSEDQVCSNGAVNQKLCNETTVFRCTHSKETLDIEKRCDGIKDCSRYGEDEVGCGHSFGLECEAANTTGPTVIRWVPPRDLCYPKEHERSNYTVACADGSDQGGEVCKDPVRECLWSAATILNITRSVYPVQQCGPIHKNAGFRMCIGGEDQIGCGPPVLQCLRNGTTISLNAGTLCNGKVKLCDDNLSDWCVPLTTTESLHRHILCDGSEACKGCPDSSACSEMETSISCVRRVRRDYTNMAALPILESWVMDGKVDCEGGEDEEESLWRECRYGNTTLYIPGTEECGVRFKCPSREVYLDPSELCNGRYKEDCPEIEKSLCPSTKMKEDLETEGSPNNTQFERYLSVECATNSGVCVNHTLGPGLYGTKPITIYALPNASFTCTDLYGLDYLYAACLGYCDDDNTACPLDAIPPIHYRDTCPTLPERNLTLALDNTLAFIEIVREEADSAAVLIPKDREIFVCNNGNWTLHSHVCDLIDDCGDHSDETNCSNHFKCQEGEFIRLDQVCDKHRDCSNSRDECYEGCESRDDRIVSSGTLAVLGWLIGIPATIINTVVIVRNIKHLVGNAKHTKINFTITVFISLVGLGDFLVGVYLVGLNAESLIWRERYCARRFDWQSSTNCQVLGVISTLGSQLSIFSMTVISIYRAYIMHQLTMTRNTNRTFYTKVAVGVTVVSLLAVLLAVIPTIGPLLDAYFLNGFYLPGSNFISYPKREADLMNVVKLYWKEEVRIDNVKQKVREMFVAPHSQPDLEIGMKSLNFYGSSSTCLFKYFVIPTDPQRAYSWVVIATNCLCFFVITTAYISVHMVSQESAGRVNSKKKWGSLQQKITIILLTDLICWIPFLVMCLLHYAEVVDLAPYYPLFSTILLPINSLINPVIYDRFFAKLPRKLGIRMRRVADSVRLRASSLRRARNEITVETRAGTDRDSPERAAAVNLLGRRNSCQPTNGNTPSCRSSLLAAALPECDQAFQLLPEKL